MKGYYTYAEAKAAVRALGIETARVYIKRYTEDPRLPASPEKIYAGAGWTDWYDFLDKEKRPAPYATYFEAKAAARALGIDTTKAYIKRYTDDPRLPANPERIYAQAGWTDWYDFLGKGKRPAPYATYAEAQAATLALCISDSSDYRARYQQDPRLLATPEKIYADAGWTGWYDFLDKEKRPTPYATYAEAQAAVRALRIETARVYIKRYTEDPRLPASPEKIYADAGWTDWYDFLDKEKRPGPYATYVEAKAAARALGIDTIEVYIKRYTEDPRLPASPEKIYADAGWTDWYGFLGKQKRPAPYATYAEAQVATQALCITDSNDYRARYQQDPRLLASPDQIYANAGWTDWYDFLGKQKRPAPYATYTEAQAAALELGIKNLNDYKLRYRQDPKLPARPDSAFADAGWTDWYDFLGNQKRPIPYATYAEAQKAALELGIKNLTDYKTRYRQDPKLPAKPEQVYADAGWTDWYDFLGNPKRLAPYATYAEAKAAAQAMRIKDNKDYKTRYRQDPKLPAKPDSAYANAGWLSWYEFLGKQKKLAPYATYAQAKAAARALGIETSKVYPKRYAEDPRLPASPDKTYAAAGWLDWQDFLGRQKRPAPYATYAEAQTAAQSLAIKDSNDYRARFRKDPRLPGSPHVIYANAGWTDWYAFLGKEKSNWYTYTEAQAAAQALGFKSREDYSAGYRQVPRLPASPDQTYANAGWTNWYDFLGKEKSPWYTYAEAKVAAQALGIENSKTYSKRYVEDPKLPASPYVTYAGTGWTDWYDFLGKGKSNWYTYTEAQAAIQILGIKSQPDYNKLYRQDPRLPASPFDIYADTGWTSWYDFVGTEAPSAIEAEYPIIWRDFKRWLSGTTNFGKKKSAIRALLADFYREQGLPDDPRYLLLRTNRFNVEAYQRFIAAQADSSKATNHSAIRDFFEWLLDEYCTDEDNDERVVLPEYRNPFVTVLAGFADSLETYRPSQTTKAPLGYEYILRARQFLVPNGEQVLQTRPSFADLPHLQEFFNSRSDWLSVDASVIDHSDPNCIWRKVEKLGQADSYQIWSPVRFVAIYTLLRFPLRGQQILWLDSGEADSEVAVFDAENGGICWEKNTGPLAGKGSKKRRPQAAIQRGSKDVSKIYVTTNKTGRTEGGYEVEWIPDDLVYWFVLLRAWQSKYNPLRAPTSWLAIGLNEKINPKILRARGTQCFLFRTDASGTPMSTIAAFFYSFPALLYQIQREGENLAIRNPDRHSRQRYLSDYTPHSLRVSLITAFIIDGGAPISIISKLVGHASLVMTIYYTKLNDGQMRQAMGEAEKRAGQLAKKEHAETIRRQGLHPLRHQLIATDGNRFLLEADVPNSACVVFDHGICPMSASACDEGGELLVERQRYSKSVYGPVEVGYLGKKNCPRCRFFITGVPFLGGLVAIANEIALEIHTESKRYQDFTAEVDRLEQEFYDACQANQPDTQQPNREQASSLQQQSASKLDGLLTDYVAINRYVQGCLKLINEGEQYGKSQDAVRLIAAGNLGEVGVAFEESKTQYHLLAEICQNAIIYQSANPSRALPLIALAIDRMAENNGLAPAMFRLSDEQKLVVANELNQLLLQRLGSWEKIDDLFAGDLMLLDVDTYEPELTQISTEIRQLLSNPNGARQISNKVPVDE